MSGVPSVGESCGELVSIVMPLYNCDQYVCEAIESVLSQSYESWELIVVDDCSTDNSSKMVSRYLTDSRIRLIKQEGNYGTGAARNKAVCEARGSLIAYLDSDDVWHEEKLRRQIDFMKKHSVGMCFTSYETIEADGTYRNTVHVPKALDYRGFLKNTVTCSHTLMLDLSIVAKEWLLLSPREDQFDYPEDLAVWLSILKKGIVARGLDEVLAKNRKRSKSRSANKLKAVKRTWNQYRRMEGFATPYAAYCLFWQLFHAVLKRL